MKPYAGLGVWIWEAQMQAPGPFCRTLRENRVAWVAVKTHDGDQAFNGPREQIERWAQAARAHGLRFGVWGYLSGQNPKGEAQMAAASVGTFKADFYIADAEIGYEGDARKSRDFMEEFFARRPHAPAVLSSFGRCDFHSLPWHEWAARGWDFMPQAYECESAALTPEACVNSARHYWPQARIFPTLGTYHGAAGVLSGGALYDSVKHLKLPGVNLWDAQELHPGQLEAVSHLVPKNGKRSEPPKREVPPRHKLLFPMDPPRTLALTSPLTRGEDVRDLQRAVNIAAEKLHTGQLAVDGIYGRSTKHAAQVVAYRLGLVGTSMTKATIRLIWHPWLRTPADHARAHARTPKAGGLVGIVKHAASHIGVAERPPGSNTGHPFPSGWEENFGVNGVPWCGAFAGSMVLAAGGHVSSRVTYCPYIEADAKARDNGFDAWTDVSAHAAPGWLVLYCWDGSGVPEHVGIVESFGANELTAVEGNTSGTNPSDGGEVARMRRTYNFVVGYARPRL